MADAGKIHYLNLKKFKEFTKKFKNVRNINGQVQEKHTIFSGKRLGDQIITVPTKNN